jgi:hypothetical protein
VPVYPIAPNGYIETEDPHVFIESMKGEGESREIVYINPEARLRWKQKGDCYSCGLGDHNWVDDKPVLPEGYELVPGKRLGERYSVRDLNYATRKDVPCTPNYPKAARKEAKDLGVEYQCGLTFEWLEYGD